MIPLLANPQFRLLWVGVVITWLSTVLLFMIMGWLVLSLTDSPFWVGAVLGMTGLGMMCTSVVGGVLADRFHRKDIVVVNGLAYIVLAGLLSVITILDIVLLWHVLLIALLIGIVIGLRTPAFYALTLDVVGRSRLLSGNAANLTALSIAGVIAPLVGGVVVNTWDMGWAFFVVAGTELMAVVVISRLSVLTPVVVVIDDVSVKPPIRRLWHDFIEGAVYVFSEPNVRTLILMGLMGEFFIWAHVTMLPVMARDVLEVGVTGFGYLQSASYGGLLVATVIVSNLGDVRRKGPLLVTGAVGFGILTMLFAASTELPFSLGLLAGAYAMAALYEITLMTLVQSIVPDAMRGRVISFQTFTWGANVFSGFHTGAIANWLGVSMAISIGAGVFLLYTICIVPKIFTFQDTGRSE